MWAKIKIFAKLSKTDFGNGYESHGNLFELLKICLEFEIWGFALQDSLVFGFGV